MKSLLSIGEAARRLGLSVDTVRELERNGALKAVRTPGGHRRFDPAQLDAYLARRSRPNTGRQRARAPTPLAPTQRAAALDDEPPEGLPDDAWDDPEPFEPPAPRPAAPTPKSPHEQLVEQITRSTERLVEENRLGGLKSYARSLIPYDASATARSAVLEIVATYITAARFPASMPLWEARQAIHAKVTAIMEPFEEVAARAAERKAEADARKAEREREEHQVKSLIERGKSRTFLHTFRWDRDDAADARAAVLEALEDEVEADWTERDVNELVDEVLEEWNEDSDD